MKTSGPREVGYDRGSRRPRRAAACWSDTAHFRLPVCDRGSAARAVAHAPTVMQVRTTAFSHRVGARHLAQLPGAGFARDRGLCCFPLRVLAETCSDLPSCGISLTVPSDALRKYKFSHIDVNLFANRKSHSSRRLCQRASTIFHSQPLQRLGKSATQNPLHTPTSNELIGYGMGSSKTSFNKTIRVVAV